MIGRGDSRARIQLRQIGVIMLAVCTATPIFNVLTLELPPGVLARRCGELDLCGKEAPVAAYSLSG